MCGEVFHGVLVVRVEVKVCPVVKGAYRVSAEPGIDRYGDESSRGGIPL
jgi:hypothetical protein